MEHHFSYFEEMRVRLQTQSQLMIARCWFKYLERKRAKEEEERMAEEKKKGKKRKKNSILDKRIA